jgi:pilus assembly protein CpaF
VTCVAEISGMECNVITMQEIFVFRQTGVEADGSVKGHFQATGVRPRFVERLKARGIVLPESLFDPGRRVE